MELRRICIIGCTAPLDLPAPLEQPRAEKSHHERVDLDLDRFRGPVWIVSPELSDCVEVSGFLGFERLRDSTTSLLCPSPWPIHTAVCSITVYQAAVGT